MGKKDRRRGHRLRNPLPFASASGSIAGKTGGGRADLTLYLGRGECVQGVSAKPALPPEDTKPDYSAKKGLVQPAHSSGKEKRNACMYWRLIKRLHTTSREYRVGVLPTRRLLSEEPSPYKWKRIGEPQVRREMGGISTSVVSNLRGGRINVSRWLKGPNLRQTLPTPAVYGESGQRPDIHSFRQRKKRTHRILAGPRPRSRAFRVKCGGKQKKKGHVWNRRKKEQPFILNRRIPRLRNAMSNGSCR